MRWECALRRDSTLPIPKLHLEQVETLVLLPEGTIYLGTQRNTIELSSVQKARLRVEHFTGEVSRWYYGDMKQTTIRLDEKDQAAIAAIRDYYGVSSDIDAIRIALREIQRQIKKEADPSPAPEQSRAIPPPHE